MEGDGRGPSKQGLVTSNEQADVRAAAAKQHARAAATHEEGARKGGAAGAPPAPRAVMQF